MFGFISLNLPSNIKLYFIPFSILISISITCVKDSKVDSLDRSKDLDQINNLLIKSKSKEGPNELRLENLNRAYRLVNDLNQDSSKIDYLFKISNQFYSLKEYSEFKKVSSEFSIGIWDGIILIWKFWIVPIIIMVKPGIFLKK